VVRPPPDAGTNPPTDDPAVESGPLVTAAMVEAAAARLDGCIPATPVEISSRLSARVGATVWLKREGLQVVRSYKVRGAYNFVVQLDEAERAAGVVSASAGNHAQGLAYACAAVGVHGRIYVPRTTPRQKRDRIAALGGDMVELVVLGDSYDDAAEAAASDEVATGATRVPAFDHPRTIAGQGTVLAEAGAAVGRCARRGGGARRRRRPAGRDRRLAARAAPGGSRGGGGACRRCLYGCRLDRGSAGHAAEIDGFVDGAAVRRAGELTYPLVRDGGAELVSVPEGQVCCEMLAMYQSDGIIAEPAGALAAAALGTAITVEPGAGVLCVVSGGNNDVSRYGEVVERALVHEGRKHYFLVDFPQEPGALRGFLDEVLGPDDDITLFEYVKRNNREKGPALVAIELGRPQDLSALLERMQHCPPDVQLIPPDSPLFRYLL